MTTPRFSLISGQYDAFGSLSQEALNVFRKLMIIIGGMILIMVVIGGLTRLTGSGLSIVEWNPLWGMVPPLNTDDWVVLFNAYKQTPEYILVNKGMTLLEFQSIFWLEFIHRLWGRLLGLMFLVPLVYSFLSPYLKRYRWPLLGILALGGLQGIVGWWMVKSGLIHDPHVSPYRLMIHLLLALATYTGVIALYAHSKGRLIKASGLFLLVSILMVLTISYGALVAGSKAGLIYNQFPLMGGSLVPEDFFYHSPWHHNFFDNPATIQWTHRFLALSVVGVTGCLAYKRPLYRLVFIIALLQAMLGILTLLMQVPVFLGVLHQLGAFVLWTTLFLKGAAPTNASIPS